MEDFIDILEYIESDDVEIMMPITRRPIKMRSRVDHFIKWDETEFFNQFCRHKRTANVVLGIIRDSIASKTNKNRAISPELQFLTTLRFYASGGFLVNIGDHSGVHYSTASKIVKKVFRALAKLCSCCITIPSSSAEITRLKSGFSNKTRFPNCTGAIDCTHVKIQSVGGDSAEIYRNRKGIFSVNVQAICDDSSLIISNIVARWPGSAHDSHIFNSFKIRKDLESGLLDEGSIIVGDSGYACTNHLITRVEHVQTLEERLFQEAQIRTRNPIERCFGVWKRKDSQY